MFENINPLRLQTMQTILESQDAEDWDTFISCWEGDDFVQIVGDPESQDVIPFFGVHRGFKEYKQCIDDYADGMFKIQEYIANEVFEMGDVTFGIGDATYIFEPTGEIIHSKHLLYSRWSDEGKIIEGRRWMESIVYYKTYKKWAESQGKA